MFKLRIKEIIDSRPDWSLYRLSQETGIRPNTISDLASNRARHWSPESLTKIAKALNLETVEELIEYAEGE
jgi:DNA-binding Xre family transcriptional regulator